MAGTDLDNNNAGIMMETTAGIMAGTTAMKTQIIRTRYKTPNLNSEEDRRSLLFNYLSTPGGTLFISPLRSRR